MSRGRDRREVLAVPPVSAAPGGAAAPEGAGWEHRRHPGADRGGPARRHPRAPDGFDSDRAVRRCDPARRTTVNADPRRDRRCGRGGASRASASLMLGGVLTTPRGTCSVLERGLPHRGSSSSARPAVGPGGAATRPGGGRSTGDVGLRRPRTRRSEELDGRLWHDSVGVAGRRPDRRTSTRALDRLGTVQVGWGQVFARPWRRRRRTDRGTSRGGVGWTRAPLRCPELPRLH